MNTDIENNDIPYDNTNESEKDMNSSNETPFAAGANDDSPQEGVNSDSAQESANTDVGGDRASNNGDPAAAPPSTDRRPLGYWLRDVDSRLTHEFVRVLRDERVHRREWMLLNLIAGDADVPERVQRRVQRGGPQFDAIKSLADRGWIVRDESGNWSLSDEGIAARTRLDSDVNDLRARVAAAVSPDDFATMMRSLEAIARELGFDESESHEHSRGDRSSAGYPFGRCGHPGFNGRMGSNDQRDSGRRYGRGGDHPRGYGEWQRHGHADAPGYNAHAHEHEHEHERGRGHGHGHGHERVRGPWGWRGRGRDDERPRGRAARHCGWQEREREHEHEGARGCGHWGWQDQEHHHEGARGRGRRGWQGHEPGHGFGRGLGNWPSARDRSGRGSAPK